MPIRPHVLISADTIAAAHRASWRARSAATIRPTPASTSSACSRALHVPGRPRRATCRRASRSTSWRCRATPRARRAPAKCGCSRTSTTSLDGKRRDHRRGHRRHRADAHLPAGHPARARPEALRTACLLSKPSRRKVDVKVEYIGFTIEDQFVVGYGLDYAEQLSQPAVHRRRCSSRPEPRVASFRHRRAARSRPPAAPSASTAALVQRQHLPVAHQHPAVHDRRRARRRRAST